MFKKAVEARSHQRLSGADRKKLKRNLKDKIPRASDSDIDSLLPPKVEISVSKFQNRVHVYGVEGGFPIFFDIDGRGTDIFPTAQIESSPSSTFPCPLKFEGEKKEKNENDAMGRVNIFCGGGRSRGQDKQTDRQKERLAFVWIKKESTCHACKQEGL